MLFRGRGCEKDFLQEEYFMGRKVSGGNSHGKILHGRNFARIHIRNSFHLSYFLFGGSMLHVKMSWGIFICGGGEGLYEKNFP